MKILDLLYVFLAACCASPVIQLYAVQLRRWLRRRALGRARSTLVLALVYREETIAMLGLPFLRYLAVATPEEIVRAIASTPAHSGIDLVVQLPAGLELDCRPVATALREHLGRVTLFVPLQALSQGATLCAAADELVVGELAAVAGSDGRPLGADDLRALGPTVMTGVPEPIRELLDLYPQPAHGGWPPLIPLAARARRRDGS